MVAAVLIFHVSVALGSVALGSYLLVRPARNKLMMNYSLIGATVASGTYLIIATGSFVLSTCVTGLTYVAVVAVLSVFAERRFATQKI